METHDGGDMEQEIEGVGKLDESLIRERMFVVAAILKDNEQSYQDLENLKKLGLGRADSEVVEAAELIKDICTAGMDPYTYFAEYIEQFDEAEDSGELEEIREERIRWAS